MRLEDSGRNGRALDWTGLESNERLDAMEREDDSEGNSELVAKRRSCLVGAGGWVGELLSAQIGQANWQTVCEP